MVDVSEKTITTRRAVARSVVSFPSNVILDVEGTEIPSKKGPVFATAIVAGTQAAKQTSHLIPFCHALALDSCLISIKIVGPHSIEIQCEVKTRAPTGVEMEAIIGATVAATTVYDMCKALTHEIVIGPIQLLAKSGGKHDFTAIS
jgi:cyclic pyranopterin phosphate synthase